MPVTNIKIARESRKGSDLVVVDVSTAQGVGTRRNTHGWRKVVVKQN